MGGTADAFGLAMFCSRSVLIDDPCEQQGLNVEPVPVVNAGAPAL